MTKKQAIQNLIKYSARFSVGVGLGISTGVTDQDRMIIRKSIIKMYKYGFDTEITESILFNLNI